MKFVQIAIFGHLFLIIFAQETALHVHINVAESENATRIANLLWKNFLLQVSGTPINVTMTNETMPHRPVYHCHLMRRAQTRPRPPSLLVHIPLGMTGDNQFCWPVIYGDMQLCAQILYKPLAKEPYRADITFPCGHIYYQAGVNEVAALLLRVALLHGNCQDEIYRIKDFTKIGNESMDTSQRKVLIEKRRGLSSFPPNEWLVYIFLIIICIFNVVQTVALNMELVHEWRNAGFKRIDLSAMEHASDESSSSRRLEPKQ